MLSDPGPSVLPRAEPRVNLTAAVCRQHRFRALLLAYADKQKVKTIKKNPPRQHNTHECCLSQVTFDEKSPADLLQQLNEIFVAIDPQQTSEHDEPGDAGTTRMMSFLVMLKFPLPEHQRESFRQGLAVGCAERNGGQR